MSTAVKKWHEVRMRREIRYVQKESFEPRLLCDKLTREEMKRWWEMYGHLTKDEFNDEMDRRASEQQLWHESDDW